MTGLPGKFSVLFTFLERHRVALFAFTIVVIAAASAVTYYGQLNEDIEAMLPDRGSEVADDFRLLQRAPLSRKGIVSLRAAPSTSMETLLQTTDRLAASMAPPFFTKVATGPDVPAGPEILGWLLRSLPMIADDEDLRDAAKELSRAGVHSKVRRIYKDLQSPTGWAMKGLYQADPLELRMIAFRKLQALRIVPDVRIESNHFVSGDGRNTMIITEMTPKMTDSGASRQMLNRFDELVKALVPPGIEVTLVSGHRYMVANADIIKKDLVIVLGSSCLAMLLLFVFFLRSWRAVFVFLVPITVLCIATAATLVLYRGVSAATIGFASVLLGITDDYPLYVYFTLRSGGDAIQKVGQISRPIIFSGATIVAAFAVLLFSNLPGQRQIGVFAMIGIAGSVLLSLVVVPHVLRPLGKGRVQAIIPNRNPRPAIPRLVVSIWLALLAVSVWQAGHVRFNGDLKSMSYVPSYLQEAERRTQAVWGDFRSMAMVFSAGPDSETALATNDLVFHSLRKELPEAQIVSLAPVFPSAATQQLNSERWMRFWKGTRGRVILDDLAREAARLGFSSSAFSPFMEGLRSSPQPITLESLGDAGLGGLADALLLKGPGGVNALTLVSDLPRLTYVLSSQPIESRRIRVVSPSRFREALSKEIVRNFTWYVIAAILSIVFVLILLFRNLAKTAYVLIPVATGVVYMLGAMGLLDIRFNIFNVIAVILVIGLAVDFGVLMIYRVTEGHDRSTDLAVLLGGLTTVAGIGMLVLARHPALHSIGITLLLGLAGAIPSALLVIPALFHLCSERRS